MQLSIGVEYALHSLFYLLGLPQGKVIGIKELSALHGISETYLSKVFTRLRKGGIVRSVPGVKGGYELARPASPPEPDEALPPLPGYAEGAPFGADTDGRPIRQITASTDGVCA